MSPTLRLDAALRNPRTALNRRLCGLGLAALVLVGCGPSGEPELSAAAAAGKSLAQTKGCASCHVFYGRDAAGPTWKDVYGNEVTLSDGSKVIADEAYLTRSIKDPWAQKVKGYGTIMPRNRLTDEEVASIVAYIKELSPNGQPGEGTTP